MNDPSTALSDDCRSRSARRPRRRGVRGTHRVVTALVAGLSLALVTTVAASAAPGTRGSDGHSSQQGKSSLLNAALPAPSEILDCEQPSDPDSPLSKSRQSAFGAESLSGATSLGAAADGSDGNLVIDLLKQIGSDAVDFGADEGFGWLLPLLTGGAKNGTDAKIQQTKQDVDHLQKQVYAMCSSLSQALADLETQVDMKAYQTMSSNGQQTTNKLNEYLQDYQNIIADLEKGNGLDGDDYSQITEMRSKLPGIIDSYDGDMMGSVTADGLIGSYADVLGDSFGYRPAPTQLHPDTTRIFPAAYVHAAWVQYNSYAIEVAQAAWLYAEVQNFDYTFQGTHYDSKPQESQDEATRAAAMLDKWGARIWGGRMQANQTGDWVTSSLGGDISDGTVADLRTQGQPRLWKLTPVTLTGDPQGSPYCGQPSLYCWTQVYDAKGNATSSTLARSIPGPINELLKRQQPLGYADWRVPTTADWNSLVAGSSGGLSTWMSANRLPALNPTTVTVENPNGRFSQISELPAMLVDTSSSGNGTAFGIVTALAGADSLRAVESSPDQQIAGQLYVVRDMGTPALSGAEPVDGGQHHHGHRHHGHHQPGHRHHR